MGAFGGFAGLFRLDYNEKLFKRNYREPVLVACTDGVGTKLKVAFAMRQARHRRHRPGGDERQRPDLLRGRAAVLPGLPRRRQARSRPDGRDRQGHRRRLRARPAAPCWAARRPRCPTSTAADEFDMAGFAVGVVERKRDHRRLATSRPATWPSPWPSNGLHSNGYGLARRVLLERAGYDVHDRPAGAGRRAASARRCSRPTRIYVRPVLDILHALQVKQVVKAMAHITGGGLPGNLPRVLPEG